MLTKIVSAKKNIWICFHSKSKFYLKALLFFVLCGWILCKDGLKIANKREQTKTCFQYAKQERFSGLFSTAGRYFSKKADLKKIRRAAYKKPMGGNPYVIWSSVLIVFKMRSMIRKAVL